MRRSRAKIPRLESMERLILCDGAPDGDTVLDLNPPAVGPLPESGGAPPGGFLEDPGGGTTPVDVSGVNVDPTLQPGGLNGPAGDSGDTSYRPEVPDSPPTTVGPVDPFS